MSEEWILQASYKTPQGDMINLRGKDAEAFSTAMETLKQALQDGRLADLRKLIFGQQPLPPLGVSGTAPVQPMTTHQAPSVAYDGQFIDGRIVEVLSRPGDTNGRKWTLSTVKLDNGFEGTTFDPTLNQILPRLKNAQVRITFGPDKRGDGHKVIKIEDLEQIQLV